MSVIPAEDIVNIDPELVTAITRAVFDALTEMPADDAAREIERHPDGFGIPMVFTQPMHGHRKWCVRIQPYGN